MGMQVIVLLVLLVSVEVVIVNALSMREAISTLSPELHEHAIDKFKKAAIFYHREGDNAPLSKWKFIIRSYWESHDTIVTTVNCRNASSACPWDEDLRHICEGSLPQLYVHRFGQSSLRYKKSLSDQTVIYRFLDRALGVSHNSMPSASLQSMLSVYDHLHSMSDIAFKFLATPAPDRPALLSALKEHGKWLSAISFGPQFNTAPMHVQAMEKAIEKNWNKARFENEARKLKRLSEEAKTVEETELLLEQSEIYRSYTEGIPKIVHMIKTDPAPDRFRIFHYLAVRAAHKWIKPERFLFHAFEEPKGHWWDKAKPFVTFSKLDVNTSPSQTTTGKQIRMAAHQSDFLRSELLYKMGGIYMDWDVIALRSFDDLLSHRAVLGMEKQVVDFKEVLGVAVMMARPRSPFIKRFLDGMHKEFDGDNCYVCHSTIWGRKLAMEYPQGVNVLNFTSFYFPGWEKSAMDTFLDPNHYRRGQTFFPPYSYASHLFESNQNFVALASHSSTEENIRSIDNHFNIMARTLID